MSEMTFAQHAEQARRMAKRAGAFDCIHYAPNKTTRADALYAIANESGIAWWNEGGNPYLIADGRMVVACASVWFFEPKGCVCRDDDGIDPS